MIERGEHKIAILSTNNAINYGAILQVYGLKKALETNGFVVSVLNYHYVDDVQTGRKVVLNFTSLKGFVLSCLKLLPKFSRLRRRKIDSFNGFNVHRLSVSGEPFSDVMSLKERLQEYSHVICGSDQIWNLNLFKDGVFLLEEVDGPSKLAYAPSIAEVLSDSQLERILYAAKSFEWISAREDKFADYLSLRLQKKVSHVVDPVFLVSADNWLKIAAKPRVTIPSEYLLVYGIGANLEFTRLVNYQSSQLDIPIVYVNLAPINRIGANTQLKDASPEEFVWLFANASEIITSSFHGLAFSLIFNKSFIAFPSVDRNSRHKSLLSKFDLDNRLIETWDGKDLTLAPISYDEINDKIKLWSRNSLDELCENIL